MKHLFVILPTVLVIVYCLVRMYQICRKEKQQRKTRVILRDEVTTEQKRNRKAMEGIRESTKYDITHFSAN